MNKVIYVICLLGLTTMSTPSTGQSKIEQLESSLSAATENEKAGIYNQLAQLYFQSDLRKSLENAGLALRSSQESSNISEEAAAHINMGLANRKLGNFQVASDNFKASLAIHEKHNSNPGKAYNYIQLAACYLGMGNSQSATDYFTKAFDTYKGLNDNQGMSHALSGIGDVHLKSGQNEKAIEKYKESITYDRKGNDNEGMAYTYNKIGSVYSNFGNYKEANTNLKIAQDMAKANNLYVLYNEISKNLKIVEKNLLDYNKSRTEFEKIEEAKIEEQIQELEHKSTQLEEQTGDFLNRIATLDEQNKISALLVKVKEDALKQEKMLKEKKEQELSLATKENQIMDAELAASKAEIDRKNAIAAQERMWRYGLIGGLVLILAIAFLLLNRYQQKRKANLLLAKQNKEISEQKEEISLQKVELESQKGQLEKKNRQITDSIDYARRIQSAVLSSMSGIRALLPESFILFRPKDVVSGDFYWIKEKSGKILFAAADCTGHGVPGAFMSLIADNVLNHVITQHATTNPGEILKLASDEIILRLQDKEVQVVESSDGSKTEWEVKDGMDIALCSFNRNDLKLQYAGAHNPLYIIRNGELIEYRGDRLFIGNTDDSTRFKTHDIQLQKGDSIYVFSDGYADQRGGPDSKKFYYQPFQEMLVEIHQMDMERQRVHLDNVITDWIGSGEQIDDMIVFGVRV